MTHDLFRSLVILLGHDKCLTLCMLIGNRPFFAAKFKRYLRNVKIKECLDKKMNSGRIAQSFHISVRTVKRFQRKLLFSKQSF